MPIVIFSLPLLFISRRHWRLPYRLAFVSVLAYFAIYLFFTQSQNDSFRFEYPMVYLAALLGILAISTERMYGRYKRLSYVAPVVAGIVAFLIFTPASYQIADSRWPVASIMNDYEHQEYVLATTEAGVLPFVSKWKVLDTYGLNDYEIARNGITDSYWDSFDPDVVVNHAGFGWPSEANPGNRFQLYEQMSRSGSYVAVAAIEIRRPFGRSRPFDYHIIFVKSDLFNFDDLGYRITNIDGETYVDIPDDFTKRFTSVSSN